MAALPGTLEDKTARERAEISTCEHASPETEGPATEEWKGRSDPNGCLSPRLDPIPVLVFDPDV
jgi:hypothetical protein